MKFSNKDVLFFHYDIFIKKFKKHDFRTNKVLFVKLK